jgi:hypothetical protein
MKMDVAGVGMFGHSSVDKVETLILVNSFLGCLLFHLSSNKFTKPSPLLEQLRFALPQGNAYMHFIRHHIFGLTYCLSYFSLRVLSCALSACVAL